MAIWLVAAMPSRMSQQGVIETYWHNKRGAKARYNEFIRSGKYVFVYLTNVEEAYPSGVD